jgi:phytoene dehydrogenase-like protein
MVDYDVVVIGSGAGGLAAAVALARAGKKVLVLEQHYLPGGWCHSFALGGYRFSPGVHYLGELQPGGMMRRMYEGLGLGQDLTFCELNPDGYDHVLLGDGPDDRFDYPKGKERLAEMLASRFPAERRGIHAYLDDVERISKELTALTSVEGLKDLAALPRRAPTAVRWVLRSARALIEHHVSNPRLRAVLAAQSGDHGLPPSRAPAVIHAAVQGHYFEGGYYPRGGGGAIPRAFILALRRAGGAIRVRAEVSRILVERGAAVGVRLADGTEIRAHTVVSNADPAVTFGKLVGLENVSRLERLRLRRSRWSVSALSLFFATDLDLRALGLDSGNYWYFRDGDVEGTYTKGLSSWGPDAGPIPGGFVTATTLKDPSKQHGKKHTLESFAFVGHDAFAKWAASASGSRPESYEANKRALLSRMLEMAGHVVPGLEKHVEFAELGTPLTNVHYCASTQGNLYGTEKSLLQIGPFAQPLATSIRGLWMCGASTLSHGVMGSHLSGLAVASRVVGCRMWDLVSSGGAPITLLPSEHPETWPKDRLRKPAEVATEEQASA